MKLKKQILALVLIILAFVACAVDTSKEVEGNLQSISAQVVSSRTNGDERSGFGYQIYVGNKLFIEQDMIPSVGGIQKFRSHIEAQAVADFVVSKLESGALPTVTLEVLDSLKITYIKY